MNWDTQDNKITDSEDRVLDDRRHFTKNTNTITNLIFLRNPVEIHQFYKYLK